jgi:Zn-dependent peptidase ImmA (M78 family)
MGSGWNPWRALREAAEIELRWMPLPESYGGGAIVTTDDGYVIVLDSRLRQEERRAVLAHELVHAERGVLPPSAPDALRAKDEHAVENEVADRLVPADELREFVEQCLSLDRFVTALDVANEFGVPIDVAERACRRVA